MREKRGQMLIISVISIVIILLTVSSLLFSTSLSSLNLPKTGFKEIVTENYFGSKAAIAAGLAKASNQLNNKMENSLFQNYTSLEELSINNTGIKQVSDWQKKAMMNKPSTGLSINFTRPIFYCDWNDPLRRHGYSIAKTNVSISLLNLGFERLEDEIEIVFNATLNELTYTSGRETSFKIRFVREKGYPLDRMLRSLVHVYFEIYDRINDYHYFNETETKSIRHLGDGTYLLSYHSDTNNITRNLSLLREKISNIPDGSLVSSRSVSTEISAGSHLVVGVRDGDYLRLYVDGEQADTPEDIIGYGSLDTDQSLLAATQYFNETLQHYFKGVIDEVRLIFEPMSPEWIYADYHNQLHENFTALGTEEILSEPWAGKWDYRRNITINSGYIDVDLVNFPLLLTLSSSSFEYEHADPVGEDIRFTDSDNNTLEYEFEKWDPSEESIIWIKVNNVIDGPDDTVLCMYYGNSDASDDQNPGSVWSGYSLVQHLEEQTGGLIDSTAHDNDGAAHGSVNQGVDGILDGAIEFDGSTGYVEWLNRASLNPGAGDFTLSLWITHHPEEVNETLLMKGDCSPTGKRYEIFRDDGGHLVFLIDDNDDNETKNHLLSIVDDIEAKHQTNRTVAWQQLLYDLRPKLNPDSSESLLESDTDTHDILRLIDVILSQLKPRVRVVARDFRGVTVSVYSELDVPEEDVLGPAITSLQAQPEQCEIGETILLSATADDRWYGGSNVTLVEYLVSESQPEAAQYGSGTVMSPTDGAFDESREEVEADLQSGSLSPGGNNLWIHGRDSGGNWGEFEMKVVTVLQDNLMHVEGIELQGMYGYWWFWRYNWVIATVTIVDGAGGPIEGASVHGVWSGDVSWEGERFTQSDGTCTFDSPQMWGWSQRTYTFTVDSVSKSGYNWDGIIASETLLYP